MKDVIQIARALQEAMEAADKTYQQVADETGLSYGAVQNAMKAKSALRLPTLIAIADVLGLELVMVPKAVAKGLIPVDPTAPPRPLSLIERLVRKSEGGG